VSSEWWRTLFTRFWHLHLTPAGFVLTAIGCILALRLPGAVIIYAWLAAAVAFVFAVGTGNLGHEYYQLPVLPPAALFFGVAAAPLFDGEFLRRKAGRVGPLAAAVALTALGLISFGESFVVRNFYRPEALDSAPIQAGAAIDAAVPKDALLIVVQWSESDNAANAPMLLYHSRRKGWSFDLRGLTPQAVQELRNRGAGYFATLIWPELQQTHPVFAKYLESQPEVPLTNAPPDTKVFRLVG
jgi:hypothetical protein